MNAEKSCEKGTVKSMVDRLSKDLGGQNKINELPILRSNRDRVNIGSVIGTVINSVAGTLTTNSGTNTTTTTTTSSVPATDTAVVRFSYAAQQPDELDLKEGDELLVLEHVEDGWAKGEITRSPNHPNKRGQIGLYPTNFVSTITATPLTQTASHSSVTTTLPRPHETTKELAKVLYKYDAAAPDELSLPEGAIVTVITRKCEDEGWFVAEMDNRRGLFPDNFVKFLPAELSSTLPQTTSNCSQQPPSLPAKPLKFQHQHHQTQTQQAPPIASTRDSLSALANTIVEKNISTITATDRENNNNSSIGGGENNNNFNIVGNRRSVIAGLQNKLFPDGKFPQPQRPSSHNAANGGRSPTRTNAEISVEPKMLIDFDGSEESCGIQSKLLVSSNSSIVKSRTGIAPNKKRPPSKVNPSSMIISSTIDSSNLINDPVSGSIINNYQNHATTAFHIKPSTVAQSSSPPIAQHSTMINSSNNNNKPTVFSSQPTPPLSTSAPMPVSPLHCTIVEEQSKSKISNAALSPSATSITQSAAATRETNAATDIGWMPFLSTGIASSSSATQWITREEFECFKLNCQRKIAELQAELNELRQCLETKQDK